MIWTGNRCCGTGPQLGTLAILLTLLCILLLPAPSAWGAAAGQVLFTTGDASVMRESQQHSLHDGFAVQQGDRLETGADGHIHLRMVDGALISIRSDSALSVVRYRYRPDTPDESEVSLTLHHGVARSISGEVGARSRERFRLETPVAAIGIRGTDFSVMTEPDLSSLSVRRGGVVMAPLSELCPPGATGPCEVSGAAELFESTPGAVLMATRDSPLASLSYEGIQPDEYRPPHPQEEQLIEARVHSRANFVKVRDSSSHGVDTFEEALQHAERYLKRPGLITDAYARGQAAPSIQPRDRGLVESPNVTWGRWDMPGETRATREVARLRHQNFDWAGFNNTFALLKQKTDDSPMPSQGRAHFNLNRYEAYIKRGFDLEVAEISHPGLVVDFEQQSFALHLILHANSLEEALPIVGGGRINGDTFVQDEETRARLEGVLASGGAEAGLLFEYPLDVGTAVGATHWALDRE